MTLGRVHSIQTLGTVDGPGVRFVVFMQGCNLRCGYCHNPDTWAHEGGTAYSPEALADKAERYRPYFGQDGGITVSGGEPLLQAEFVKELFMQCHKRNIHTCLDTSGSLFTADVMQLLEYTDYVLLDIKFTDETLYKTHVGCSMDAPLTFLEYLNAKKIPTTLRQVIVPSLNDTEENIRALGTIIKKYPCIQKTELLPFRKICTAKYENMGIPFPFASYPIPAKEQMRALEEMLSTQK